MVPPFQPTGWDFPSLGSFWWPVRSIHSPHFANLDGKQGLLKVLHPEMDDVNRTEEPVWRFPSQTCIVILLCPSVPVQFPLNSTCYENTTNQEVFFHTPKLHSVTLCDVLTSSSLSVSLGLLVSLCPSVRSQLIGVLMKVLNKRWPIVTSPSLVLPSSVSIHLKVMRI